MDEVSSKEPPTLTNSSGVEHHLKKLEELRQRRLNIKANYDKKYNSHAKNSNKTPKDIPESSLVPSSILDEELQDMLKHRTGVEGEIKSQSGLEMTIDKAIELGDVETAFELSDRLAVRSIGARISRAFEADRFHKKRQRLENLKAKKRKMVPWYLRPKQRWETKSNM